MTPVLCDQLEAPGLSERLESFLGVVRRETHERDGAGLRAAGETALAEEIERSWGDYERALDRLRGSAATSSARWRRTTTWTSSATHAILPLLASDAGVREQLHSGIASHRRRFGPDWQGGLWLPECAHEPRLERVLREEGVLASCVELTGRFGLGAPEHLHPILDRLGTDAVPGRSPDHVARMERRRLSLRRPLPRLPPPHDPPSQSLEQRRRALPTTPRRRSSLPSMPGTSSRGRSPGLTRPRPEAGLAVCALDTELLGHWWYEGIGWLRSVIEESARQGLELVSLDDARERFEPVERADQPGWAASSWGKDGDLSTWSGRAVVELAFATRRAELELLAGGPAAGLAAIRELLALQSSDWAFMVSRQIAEPYARERFAGHLAAFRRALAEGPQVSASGLRNLAIDASRAAFSAPS